MLQRYKKYICPEAKKAMDLIDEGINEDTSLSSLDHLLEGINILEYNYRLFYGKR